MTEFQVEVVRIGDVVPHVREGWVVKPEQERRCDEIGRVILKLHGQGYLTRKGA